MMSLTMSDPEVKVQLFRFIDALPALNTPESVVNHLREYLEQAGGGVPWWLRSAVELAPAGTLRGEILAWSATNGTGPGTWPDGSSPDRRRTEAFSDGSCSPSPPPGVHGRPPG